MARGIPESQGAIAMHGRRDQRRRTWRSLAAPAAVAANPQSAIRNPQSRWRSVAALAAVAIGTVAVAWMAPGASAQDPPADAPAKKDPAAKKPRGGLRVRVGAARDEARGKAADPLAAPDGPVPAATPEWPYHYRFALAAFDGARLFARYYPSRLGPSAPVVMLVHEVGAGRSGKDFEEPIDDKSRTEEKKPKGLAESLQDQGYAVLIVDLRGHGGNRRQEISRDAWRGMTADLQAAYQFLIDRHNRKEINLAKLGVVGLGEGANLAAAWAASPFGAVSVEGRPSDLAALVLVSPSAEVQGVRVAPTVASLAPRLPLMLLAGKGDTGSAEVVQASQPVVSRQRLGKVEVIDTRLHGFQLLRFAPGASEPILSFLENTVKFRTDEWEPRYNLTPVAYAGVQLVDPKAPPSAAPAPPPAEPEKKAAEPAADPKKADAPLRKPEPRKKSRQGS